MFQAVPEGERYVTSALVLSDERPKIEWKKDGKPIETNVTVSLCTLILKINSNLKMFLGGHGSQRNHIPTDNK